MEAKKSKKADLRSKRVLFFEIGMILAITCVFAAFQWTTDENVIAMQLSDELNFDIEDEWMPVNREIEKPEKEQPKQQTVEVIDIVEDTEDIDDLEIADVEGDNDIAVAIIAMDDEDLDNSEPEIFFIVEDPPIYPGGPGALLKEIMGNVVYPEIAKENGIQGRVFVQFIVNKKGNVDKVQVARGVDPSLDREAVRVVKLLSGWTPGKQRGKPVNVSFTVPIHFQLN